MRSHRLSRLTLLTQGIALIGFGMSELACTKAPPQVNGPAPGDQLHINAPPAPAPDAAAAGVGADTPPPVPKHVNAPRPNPT